MPNVAVRLLCTFVVVASFVSAPAFATAQRTFVASTGDDANACSIAAPCRGFAAAILQTNPFGEVIVLDSAGYGPAIITQSVSIIASPGVYAGVTVFSGDGITINGAGATVTLKGLTINGQGGDVGINVAQGFRVNIERCTVKRMGFSGISITAPGAVTNIADAIVQNNTLNGIEFIGATNGTVSHTRTEFNGSNGIYARNGALVSIASSVSSRNGTFGVRVENTIAATTRMSIDGLEAIGNAAGVVVNASPAGSESIVHVARANLSYNSTSGMQVCCNAYAGTATASLSDSLVTNSGNSGVALFAPNATWSLTMSGNRIVNTNGIGLFNFNDQGTLRTRGDNIITDNTPDTSGALTPLGGT